MKSFDWEFERSRGQYLRSLRINPNNSTTLFYYSLLLSSLNELDTAISTARAAVSIDPLNPSVQENYIRILGFQRKFDEAYDYYITNQVALGQAEALPQILIELGDTIGGLQKTYEMIDTIPNFPEHLKLNIAEAIERKDGSMGFQVLVEMLQDKPQVLIAAGRYDEAFEILFEDVKLHDGGLTYLLVDPAFDPVRNDPRFKELVKQVGLDKYQ